jgi:prepilin-type N-terminal cleavage/methylation domain-containing protein/prepilin-type processing-associated H-X9-DG protein
MRNPRRQPRHAFTLIELLVVVAIIALLISILLPALSSAREKTRQVKCLSNLRSLGQAVVTYTAESRNGALPGPLHPAVYVDQGIDAIMSNPSNPMNYDQAVWFQNRFLTFKLRRALGDTSSYANSIADEVSTCPTAIGVNPKSNFAAMQQVLGYYVWPTYYALNNYGSDTFPSTRATEVPQYFGFSAESQNPSTEQLTLMQQNPPRQIGKIKSPGEEWMIADAWYRRSRTQQFAELSQEGPYQVDWTGDALPYYPPHGLRGAPNYVWSPEREDEAYDYADMRKDGKTNSVYFDGHAEGVKSMTYTVGNGFDLMYGFPGTKHPARINPNENHNAWRGAWH